MNHIAMLGRVVDRVVTDPEMPDLTLRQLGVLMRVEASRKALSVRELAPELNISKPAITRAIDRLADLGLVERKEGTQDRRLIEVRATAKGVGYLHKLDRAIAKAA